MTNKEIIKEFERWISAGRPKVWVKALNYQKSEWILISVQPEWSKDNIYIVDDHQAELRKLQIDNPDTKFQACKPSSSKEECWYDCTPIWYLNCRYRIKPKEPETKTIYEWIYKSNSTGRWFTTEALMTEKEAEVFFDSTTIYKKTGREFEVEI